MKYVSIRDIFEFPVAGVEFFDSSRFHSAQLVIAGCCWTFCGAGKAQGLGEDARMFCLQQYVCFVFFAVVVPKYDSHGFTDIHDNDDVT